jgi:hypothetical protein
MMEGKILFECFFSGKKIGTPIAIGGRKTVLDNKKLVLLKKILFLHSDLFIKSFNL